PITRSALLTVFSHIGLYGLWSPGKISSLLPVISLICFRMAMDCSERGTICGILKQIKDITGNNELIFPGDHNPYKPMCENTVNKALRVMGYDTKKDICGHGFRAMACSALMESGLWAKDAVERQMSHQERNTVRMAYIHKAEHLEARKAMMQWWSDYLDICRKAYVSPYMMVQENR
ncbi:tyrosine-type recombinase/integrase, partial [Klebsiella pneumoniae]|uniref:tyrosine-type recombinase/integrase n=1 Tax=Klebsiella pneumoniae TaxID=573 RepID=UPI0038D3CC1E